MRRANPHTGIPALIDASDLDAANELELRIEMRLRRERIEGGAHIPLGECNGDAIYHPRGE